MTAIAITLEVNGNAQKASVEASTLLVNFLRDGLGLTGTHVGCDTTQCGACTVLVDGAATKSCSVLVVQLNGAQVTTIEGLTTGNAALHPMQQAFGKHHGLQCGYCTPGMIMRAVAMDAEGVAAEPEAVRCALSGNLCRCTGYFGIVNAVYEGLRQMRHETADIGITTTTQEARS